MHGKILLIMLSTLTKYFLLHLLLITRDFLSFSTKKWMQALALIGLVRVGSRFLLPVSLWVLEQRWSGRVYTKTYLDSQKIAVLFEWA